MLKNLPIGLKMGSINPPIALPALPPTNAPAAPPIIPPRGPPSLLPIASPTRAPPAVPTPVPIASASLSPAPLAPRYALTPRPPAIKPLPSLLPINFLILAPAFAALPMLRRPLTRLVTTHPTVFAVANGFLRNAIPRNIGAAANRNCPNPNNPLRDMGFSINFTSPSNADPTRNDVILKTNLPIAASPCASFCTLSGFLETQSNTANPMNTLKIPPKNLAIAPKNPPKADFAASLKFCIAPSFAFFPFFSL